MLRLFVTLWTAVVLVVYWRAYGPVNFLWFSDIALILLAVNLWLDNRILASVIALFVLVPECLWLVDFFSGLLGIGTFGPAAYMFDAARPLHLRLISLFHLWLPAVILWHVWRLGYAPRARRYAFLLAPAILLLSRLFSTPAQNVNWVYGPGFVQAWMPNPLYLLLLIAFILLCFIHPAHQLLSRLRSDSPDPL